MIPMGNMPPFGGGGGRVFTLGVGPVSAVGSGLSSSITLLLTGTTVGRQIIVGAAWTNNGLNIVGITCSGEADLTVHSSATYYAGVGFKQQFASLANNTTGGDKTIVVSFSGAGYFEDRAFAIEVAGGNAAALFDADSSGFNASSTNPSITHTTGTDNALIMALCQNSAPSSLSAGSGFTSIDIASTFLLGEYKLNAGAVGAKTVNFVDASTAAWAIKSASFSHG